jgi:hypothetical protein
VDEIYRKLDRVAAIKGLRGGAAIRDKLVAHEADARRALALTTLKTNIAVPLTVEQCVYRGTIEAGRRALKELFGFDKIRDRFPKAD